jgi:hypothetical protein
MASKRIFVSADHGMAIVYFLQSDVIPSLIEAGIEVVLLTDDALCEKIEERFGRPGLIVEGLRLDAARKYAQEEHPEIQWWLGFFRRVGASRRINTEAMDSYIDQVAVEEGNRRRIFMPLAWGLIALLRRFRAVRQFLVRLQGRYTPGLYADLFERYQPDFVVASTPGWRLDRYLLREAAERGIPTGAVVVGWDNPSSYSLCGAHMDWITCWSEIQKEELVLGSDWNPERVYIGGMPSYDGYLNNRWVMSKGEYFKLHNLDDDRRLISYACSFISFSPNIQNVRALVELVNSGSLASPSQLLIRLHPNHFLDVHLFAREREEIYTIASENELVHVVEPVPLGGELGHYSGEDMPEKASMMTHSDVFVTVYSTMVVEAAVHDCPIVSLCLDVPGGWNTLRKYSLPLSEIGNWPTHQRFREAGAGKVALDTTALTDAINEYLKNPLVDQAARQEFIKDEITYIDGTAGVRTATYLISRLPQDGLDMATIDM